MPMSRLAGPWAIAAAVALLLLAGCCHAAEDGAVYAYSCNTKSFKYNIQRPWDASSSASFVSPFPPPSGCAAITTTVYTDDAPFKSSLSNSDPGSNPRTELRIINNYTSSTHELSLEVNIASGVVDTTIAQILDVPLSGSGGQDPSLQLRVGKNAEGISEIRIWSAKSGGGITNRGALITGVYGKFIPIRIVHSATNKPGTISLYANGVKVGPSLADFGTNTIHYFKLGVYAQTRTSAASRKKRQASFRTIVYK